MSVTFGFYNSVSGDRRYNTVQISELFDGIINDGVFMSIGDTLMVAAASGMNITVGTGRAWFNHTWTNNDASLVLTVDQAEVVLHRIDLVVLEVSAGNAVRANTIKIVKGTPGSSPVAPILVETEDIHQYPLAHIYVEAGVTSIITANITNKIGTVACPFITGILETMNIDALVAQWEGEFDVWFASIAAILDESTAGNLLAMINDHISTQLVDYVRHPAFGPATGAINAYTFSAMAAAVLVDGMSVYLDNVIAANTGAATFNWSGLGAKAIVDAKGAALISGKMPLNCIVGLRYNASTASFQLLGEGGEYGTAVVADVKNTVTIGLPTGVAAGTMPVNGAPTATITNQNGTVVIPTGYNPGGTITAVLTALAAAVIKAGTTVGGILGTFTNGATATAANMLAGVTAWVAGVLVTGTMPNVGAQSIMPTAGNVMITAGYHNGNGGTYAEANLVAGKIKDTVSIFNVVGTYDHESANPITAGTVVSPRVGFVNGAKVTGTVTEKSNSGLIITPSTITQTIPEGRYQGNWQDGYVAAVANASPGNIKLNVTIAGQVGTYNNIVFSAGNNPQSNREKTIIINTTTNSKFDDVLVLNGAVYRIKFNMANSGSGTTAYGQIYKNNVPYGIARSLTSPASSVEFTEDLAFAAGDHIQLYFYNPYNTAAGSSSSFSICTAEPSLFTRVV